MKKTTFLGAPKQGVPKPVDFRSLKNQAWRTGAAPYVSPWRYAPSCPNAIGVPRSPGIWQPGVIGGAKTSLTVAF
jgi:hypothetical protein